MDRVFGKRRMPALWGMIMIAAIAALGWVLGSPPVHEFGTGLCLAVGMALPVEEFKRGLQEIQNNLSGMESRTREYETQIKDLRQQNEELSRQLGTLRKTALGGGSGRMASVERGRFVSDECARHLAAIVVLSADRLGKLSHMNASAVESLRSRCTQILGIEAKAALTSSDIPLPTVYGSEVVELVWMYGQARRFGTVYPLGTGTVKLPKLKTSPAFGFIDASATVTEKSPQIEFVTFTAQKAGGLIRLPSEINEDSIVAMGNFLARYIARETAKWEDTCFFAADGTATYKSMKGIGKAAVDLGNKVVLAATKTHPSDITLADLRLLRTKVNTAALNNSAYFLNMTHEQLLTTFNTGGDMFYIPNGANGPTLDGFPIRWVDVLPVYGTGAAASQIQVCFGDAAFQYLGVNDDLRVETSADMFFATDEIAVRGLERFCVNLMADGAVAALQLAAA